MLTVVCKLIELFVVIEPLALSVPVIERPDPVKCPVDAPPATTLSVLLVTLRP